jgi:3-hydroxyacyl-[acyl-carrier-protein] dehydratase
MLLNSLFFVEQQTTETGSVSASVRIDGNHKIFQGHFPGHPVVPGVCMVQLIRELLEETLKARLHLKSAGNIKFLTVINPLQNSQVEATVTFVHEADRYVVNATLFNGDTTFFKLSKAYFTV